MVRNDVSMVYTGRLASVYNLLHWSSFISVFHFMTILQREFSNSHHHLDQHLFFLEPRVDKIENCSS